MGQSRRGCAGDSSAGRVSRATIASPPQTPPAAGVCRQMPPCEAAPGSQNHGRWGRRSRTGHDRVNHPASYLEELPKNRGDDVSQAGDKADAARCVHRDANQQVAPHTGRGPSGLLPRSIRPTGSGPPRHERRGLHCDADAFVLGLINRHRGATAGEGPQAPLGAASLRPPLQARLRTECGLAAPLNRPSSRAARTSSRAWAVRSPRRSRPPRWQATRLWARVSPS